MEAHSSLEIFGITEESASLCVRPHAGDESSLARRRGALVLCAAGEERVVSASAVVRLEGLEPDAAYVARLWRGDLELAACRFRTLAAPPAPQVASFATIDDPHFGEVRQGAACREGEPWRFMNDDAVAAINRLAVDAVIVKGDLTHAARPEQFAAAAATLARLRAPLHLIFGNHDLGNGDAGAAGATAHFADPAAPGAVRVGGWLLVMLDTVEPGAHRGRLDEAQLGWLEEVLSDASCRRAPTLLLMHHQLVLHGDCRSRPDSIGLRREDSLRLVGLLRDHAQVRGILSGHSHRNRVQYHPALDGVPLVEVCATKDYPGAYAHYRLFADGSFRQEVRRIASRRALRHSEHCRGLPPAGPEAVLGPLWARSFASEPSLACVEPPLARRCA